MVRGPSQRRTGNWSILGPKGGISIKQKFQGKCFNSDKVGHQFAYCKLPKKKKNHEANVLDNIAQEVGDIGLSH